MSRTYKKDTLFRHEYINYIKPIRWKNRNKYSRSGKFCRKYRNKQLRAFYREYLYNSSLDYSYSDYHPIRKQKKTLMWDIW